MPQWSCSSGGPVRTFSSIAVGRSTSASTPLTEVDGLVDVVGHQHHGRPEPVPQVAHQVRRAGPGLPPGPGGRFIQKKDAGPDATAPVAACLRTIAAGDAGAVAPADGGPGGSYLPVQDC
ncbi:hypothetical protein L083_3804 [Actinoplanes sp. N902-109]|nr:hypothetical protein L083_3804 [Actinoplanes sp. N902-109]